MKIIPNSRPGQPERTNSRMLLPKSSAAATSSEVPGMSPTSLVQIFRPVDVVVRLREIHGRDFLSEIDFNDGRLPADSNTVTAQTSPTQTDIIRHAGLVRMPTLRPSIRRQINELELLREEGDFGIRERYEKAYANLSSEEHLRSKRYHELLSDPNEGWRHPLVATTRMISAIWELEQMVPNFGDFISVVANAAALSAATGLPLQIPPTLLVGPPGIGKSHLANRMAAVLGTSCVILPMNLSPAFGLLAGLAPVWRGSAPGRIASMLLAARNASPLLVLDEVEKAIIANSHDRPLDTLHSLWESENAAAYKDEYFDIRFDARNIINIATANGTEGISGSLLDRLLVLTIKPPTLAQRRHIAEQIYRKATTHLCGRIAINPQPDVLDHLAMETPRRVTRLLMLAIPITVAAGREAILIDDLRSAQALLDSARTQPRQFFGFLPPLG